jgi:hypothetical protein
MILKCTYQADQVTYSRVVPQIAQLPPVQNLLFLLFETTQSRLPMLLRYCEHQRASASEQPCVPNVESQSNCWPLRLRNGIAKDVVLARATAIANMRFN